MSNTLKTVNILVFEDHKLCVLQSFPDTLQGNKTAREMFRSAVRDTDIIDASRKMYEEGMPDEEILQNMLDNGYAGELNDCNTEVLLFHSTS